MPGGHGRFAISSITVFDTGEESIATKSFIIFPHESLDLTDKAVHDFVTIVTSQEAVRPGQAQQSCLLREAPCPRRYRRPTALNLFAREWP